MIDLISKFVEALNSDAGPWSIAFAMGLGMIMGLTPFWSAHNLIILLFAFVFRIHLASFWLGVAAFSGFAYMLDPVMIGLGETLLAHEALVPTWTQLYQSDFWRFTRFNNTMTLGSLAFAIIAFIPVVIFFRLFVTQYRDHIMDWVNRMKLVQMLKTSRLFGGKMKSAG